MATTTIHVPDDLLADIDRAANVAGLSRNRFVLQACRDAVARHGGEWPPGFFLGVLAAADKSLVEEATREMERDIRSMRRNRGAAAL